MSQSLADRVTYEVQNVFTTLPDGRIKYEVTLTSIEGIIIKDGGVCAVMADAEHFAQIAGEQLCEELENWALQGADDDYDTDNG